jgi:hypothetical protein
MKSLTKTIQRMCRIEYSPIITERRAGRTGSPLSDPLSPFCGDGRSRIHRWAGGEWTAERTLTCRGEAAGYIPVEYIQYFICDFLKNRTICSNRPGWRGDAVGDATRLVLLLYLSLSALRPLAKDALRFCLIVLYLVLIVVTGCFYFQQ